jgi:hypothetical protein
MSLIYRVAIGVSLLGIVAAPVGAQTNSLISVGADYGVDIPRSDALERSKGFGVSVRLPRPEAWSAAWDFGSLSSDFLHAFSGQATDIGSLKVRPVLGGVAYTWRGRRLEATATLTAGVSFVSLDLNDRGRERIRTAFGPREASVESGPVLAVQPKLTLWYDTNGRFGLGGTAGYLRTRPEIAFVTTPTTVDDIHVNADRVRLSAGIVVKVY